MSSAASTGKASLPTPPPNVVPCAPIDVDTSIFLNSPAIIESEKLRVGRARSSSDEGRARLGRKLKEIAKEVVGKEDVWAKYNIAAIKAERIKRHQYDPAQDEWRTDESIVRMQEKPFDEGAMRQCYRMKKLSQLPSDATNHAYHKIDWNQAPNYVAKSYKTADGSINTSEEGREACFGDIKLQYEAAHWASVFNSADPPKKIHIIRAYAIEFVDRHESPVMTVERFIEGTDEYGAGYVKHNTNSGFVDTDMKRLTPQLFSAFSFYASKGTRMVVDVQGVGDLYTDPQVHSLDLRFGEADLGLRGFALFFHSFQQTDLAFALGVPRFELSRNEKRALEAKAGSRGSTVDSSSPPPNPPSSDSPRKKSIAFQADQLKMLRVMQTSDAKGLKKAKAARRRTAFPAGGRKGSERINETITSLLEEQTLEDQRVRRNSAQDCVKGALEKALQPPEDPFAYMTKIDTATLDERGITHDISSISPDECTKAILGRVHLEIAVLYGLGRFNEGEEDSAVDLESAFHHICMGAMYNDPLSLVTLARALMHLSTDACPDVGDVLEQNHLKDNCGKEDAAGLLKRAAEGGAVGHDEKEILDARIAAISLLLKYTELKVDEKISYGLLLLELMGEGGGGGDGGRVEFTVGEKVQAAYGGGESFYDAEIREIGEDGRIRVYYPEDDEEEVLTAKYVKKIEEAGDHKGGFAVGERVKAAYGGGESWYDAEVREVGEDGSIRVYYFEDDEEEVLTAKYVKSADEAETEEDNGDEEEGETREETKGGIDIYEVYEILGSAYVDKGEGDKGKEMFGKAGEAAAKAGLAAKAMALSGKS